MRDDATPAKRRWAQFSLKWLLLIMLLVAAYFAGWRSGANRLLEAELEAVRQRDMAEQRMQQALVQQQLAQRAEQMAMMQLKLSEAKAVGREVATEGTKENMAERQQEQQQTP